jgi:NAD(P)-dependent dehydrogenase (short-subunit alcohol dehydrogenase family)
MARIFVTGSSTGLGLMTAQLLIEQGHAVVLHGRSANRTAEAQAAAPGAAGVVTGDLSRLAAMREVAEQANRFGRFDAVIHNAGVGYRETKRIETEDGVPHLFATNVLAPYVLTALIRKPARLVYLSSGMHRRTSADLGDLLWTKRPWRGAEAYAESKLYDAALAFAIARLWPDVRSNALEPGWVATRMGGPGAPDDIGKAHLTQAWLAVSDDSAALTTGGYFCHQKPLAANPVALDTAVQDGLLAQCKRLSGVAVPRSA